MDQAGRYQKIVVDGFLYDGSKVLLVRRSDKETFLPGYFEMPGGKVDFGEDLHTALRREYSEEVGVQIHIGRLYYSFSYVSDENRRHTIELIFLVSMTDDSQEIVLDESHDYFVWVSEDEMRGDKLKITEEMRKAVLAGFDIIS